MRVPHQRQFATESAEAMFKLKIAAGGPRAVQTAYAETGTALSDEKALKKWDHLVDFDNWTIDLPAAHHLTSELTTVDELGKMLYFGYHWSVMQWQRRTLVTSDHPVVLVPGDDRPHGVGWGS